MYHRKYNHSGPTHVQQETKVEERCESVTQEYPSMTLNIPELARELRISEKTARLLARESDFPSFSIGKRILINREGLQHWLDIRSAKQVNDETKETGWSCDQS